MAPLSSRRLLFSSFAAFCLICVLLLRYTYSPERYVDLEEPAAASTPTEAAAETVPHLFYEFERLAKPTRKWALYPSSASSPEAATNADSLEVVSLASRLARDLDAFEASSTASFKMLHWNKTIWQTWRDNTSLIEERATWEDKNTAWRYNVSACLF